MRVDDGQKEHGRRTGQRHHGLVETLRGDQRVGDHEYRGRVNRVNGVQDLSTAANRRDAVIAPRNLPSLVTAISGLRSFAIAAATLRTPSRASAEGMLRR